LYLGRFGGMGVASVVIEALTETGAPAVAKFLTIGVACWETHVPRVSWPDAKRTCIVRLTVDIGPVLAPSAKAKAANSVSKGKGKQIVRQIPRSLAAAHSISPFFVGFFRFLVLTSGRSVAADATLVVPGLGGFAVMGVPA
jgi:hypothetical protein